MCSTLEAIYFAAMEVVDHEHHEKTNNNTNKLIHLMWLFGVQRASAAIRSAREGRPLPYSREGKEMQRELRRTEKGSEKHLRDIEVGKRLRAEATRSRTKITREKELE